MVSVMTTPTVTPSRSRSPDRSAAALASGSVGSSANSPESTLEPSTPAAACTRPSAFSVISVRPLRASTRTASASISLRRSASRSSGSVGCVDDAALALGHHLAGDHHDVVVAQPRCGRGDGRGEVVARPELGQPWHRKQLDGGRRIRAPSRLHPRQIQSGAHHFGRGLRDRSSAAAPTAPRRRRSRRGRPRAPASRRGCRRRSGPRNSRRPLRRCWPPRSPTGIRRPCRAAAFRR